MSEDLSHQCGGRVKVQCFLRLALLLSFILLKIGVRSTEYFSLTQHLMSSVFRTVMPSTLVYW